MITFQLFSFSAVQVFSFSGNKIQQHQKLKTMTVLIFITPAISNYLYFHNRGLLIFCHYSANSHIMISYIRNPSKKNTRKETFWICFVSATKKAKTQMVCLNDLLFLNPNVWRTLEYLISVWGSLLISYQYSTQYILIPYHRFTDFGIFLDPHWELCFKINF